ncbi:MAG: hypothetical protein LBE56_02475 [Tannerella sp.]|jgi:hypothetical protein|nr:hypothetical protein [Tannerella sp.]
MKYPFFDREQLDIRSLDERANKVVFERDMISPMHAPQNISESGYYLIEETAERIRTAREKKSSVMLAFGAHTIKNCMAPTLIELMKGGWVTHLATNGAGIIHDWEIAFQGQTSEDVRTNVERGQFGIWEEPGFFINLAIIAGAYEGLGYGESVGKMIACEGLKIPEISELFDLATRFMSSEPEDIGESEILHHGQNDVLLKIKYAPSDPERAAAAIDFAGVIKRCKLKAGWMPIPHPYKQYSVQAQAYELGIPFTGHPMFGHDIIYTHPMNHGAAIGRTALTDFQRYAASVSHLEDGVYMSVGSAVMSPMIFEKSLSMAQNIKIQGGKHIDNHYILVVDLAESDWDWQRDGEPPMDHPAYYLRYCKTFHRMGGEMHYLTADNRDFLLALYRNLSNKK